MGRRIVRSVFDNEGVVIGRTEGLVVGWLDAHESDYMHSVTGKPAPLWRVRYMTGALAGDEADLEEQDVLDSLPLDHHHYHPVVKVEEESPLIIDLLAQLRGFTFGVKKIRASAGSSSASPRCLG